MYPIPFPATLPARSVADNASLSKSARLLCHSVDNVSLLRGGREALIQHGDDTYRLRHTRNGKLILTK